MILRHAPRFQIVTEHGTARREYARRATVTRGAALDASFAVAVLLDRRRKAFEGVARPQPSCHEEIRSQPAGLDAPDSGSAPCTRVEVVPPLAGWNPEGIRGEEALCCIIIESMAIVLPPAHTPVSTTSPRRPVRSM